MAAFQCIRCGKTAESKQAHACPVCGYRMFEAPYDRAELLRKEITSFLSRLRPCEISAESFTIFRRVPKKKQSDGEEWKTISKSEDDQRFPDFARIQGFVCASTKTEMFCERLTRSIEQIRTHIHEAYRQEYQVSLERITEEIRLLDDTLDKAMGAIGTDITLPEVTLPELVLHYTETPDHSLTVLADSLLDKLIALTDKIRKFIKQNNIYGTAYQKKPKLSAKPDENRCDAGEIKKCDAALSKVLAKKYTVDIFSDGSEELGEMLKALWTAVWAIMTAPVLKKSYVYVFPDGTEAVDHEIEKALFDQISVRYAGVDEAIYSYDFLSGQSDEALFELYEKMIELDSYGILGVQKGGLLKTGESEKRLNELIGLSGIKKSVQKIKAYALANKDSAELNINMCFLGNPGSGKTEVARYMAGILHENGILPTKKIVEVDRSGLVSQYFGATAEKTSRVINSAMGGVLFIDEAYALGNNSEHGGITDYGKEAIDTLVKAMEDHRGKFCVILAGYRNEMLKMLATNPGFQSRIQFSLDFPNYSRDELKSIAELMLVKRQYTIGSAAMNRILDITDIKRKEANFANAREIRNILDQVIMCQNVRCIGTGSKELGIADVEQYIRDAKINLPVLGSGAKKKLLTGEEELDQLIGLTAVKRMVKKIKAYGKRNKGEPDFNIHMCFFGNPGTGKTEVARILSRILYDAGVLDEAKLVETDGQGLLGSYVGETAPKTTAKINDAMGGVLFIDEAYSLASSHTASGSAANYGEEAIAVLLKEMEDRRGQFCVILAGYKDEMKSMLSTNPGFVSRIQFTLEFPDYSREELGQIAKAFLFKKKYEIEEDALEKLLDTADYYRKRPNFANARTIRNILDQVLMNQNLRTEDSDNDNTVILDDVEDYLTDEGINLSDTSGEKRSIGFV